MKVGDLVARKWGEGQRPMAMIVGWHDYRTAIIMWIGKNKLDLCASKYLEVVDEKPLDNQKKIN